MGRLAYREREQDETLARMGQLELQRKRYAEVQFAAATGELPVETLQLGMGSYRATMKQHPGTCSI